MCGKEVRKKYCLVLAKTSALIITVSLGLIGIQSVDSYSSFTDRGVSAISATADKLTAPPNLKVVSSGVGENSLTWTASTKAYTQGYRIFRSKNSYGPWTQINTLFGRTVVKYVDTTAGSTQWIYRVESFYNTWQSVTDGYEAPPMVGNSFYDSFDTGGGPLDGRRTEDGKSYWQVWSGDMYVGTINAFGTPGNASPGNGDVGVVRTPAHNAWMFASDFDGFERFIFRGKDPDNYLYAGGGGPTGSFEIAEIRNGVKKVLASSTPGANKDFRLEVSGENITAYIDAKQNDVKSGTLHLSAKSTFLQTDPDATYFGIGFTKGEYGISDFTFEAL